MRREVSRSEKYVAGGHRGLIVLDAVTTTANLDRIHRAELVCVELRVRGRRSPCAPAQPRRCLCRAGSRAWAASPVAHRGTNEHGRDVGIILGGAIGHSTVSRRRGTELEALTHPIACTTISRCSIDTSLEGERAAAAPTAPSLAPRESLLSCSSPRRTLQEPRAGQVARNATAADISLPSLYAAKGKINNEAEKTYTHLNMRFPTNFEVGSAPRP